MSRRKQSNPKSVKQSDVQDQEDALPDYSDHSDNAILDQSGPLVIDESRSIHEVPLDSDLQKKSSLNLHSSVDFSTNTSQLHQHLSSFRATPSSLPTTPTKPSSLSQATPTSLVEPPPLQSTLPAAPAVQSPTTPTLYGSWRPPSVWTHEKSTGGFTPPGTFPLNKHGGRLVSPSKTRRKSDKIQPVLTIAGEAGYVCPVCQFILTDQSELTKHIRSHNISALANTSGQSLTTISEKKATPQDSSTTDLSANANKCTICSKVLSSLSSLDRHMLVHSGERPFNCLYCSMSFTTNGNMHRHMRIHVKGGLTTTTTKAGHPSMKFIQKNFEKIPKITAPVKMKPSASNSLKRKILPLIKNESLNNLLSSEVNTTPGYDVSAITPPTLLPLQQPVSPTLASPTAPPPPPPPPTTPVVKQEEGVLTSTTGELANANGVLPLTHDQKLKSVLFNPESMLDTSTSILKNSSYMCPICIRDCPGSETKNFQFLSTFGLDCHFSNVHDGVLRCTDCKLEDVNIDGNHKKASLNSLFISEITLRRHKSNNHPNSKKDMKLLNKAKSFSDLTFTDCSSSHFPLVAKTFCENSKIRSKSCNTDQRRCFTCRRCRIVFPSRSSLSMHSRSHAPERNSTCEHCSVIHLSSDTETNEKEAIVSTNFQNMTALRKHQLKQHKPSEIMQSYKELSDEQKENKIQDVMVKDEFLLLLGLKRNPSRNIIKRPVSESNYGISKIKKTSFESKAYSNAKEDLRPVHSVSPTLKHPSNEMYPSCNSPSLEAIQCFHCPAVLDNMHLYRLHISMRHRGLSPFYCNVCDFTSNDKSSLVTHLRVHSSERPYYCLVCHLPFTTKVNCERHVKKKHTRADVLFSIGFTLESKRNTSSPINGPRCPHCNLIITTVSLDVHISICQIHYPFTCTHCPRRFASREKAMRHLFNGHNAPNFSEDQTSSVQNTPVDFSIKVKKQPLTNVVAPVNNTLQQEEAMDLSTSLKREPSTHLPSSTIPNKFQIIAPLSSPVPMNTSSSTLSTATHFQSPSLSSQSILAQHLKRRQQGIALSKPNSSNERSHTNVQLPPHQQSLQPLAIPSSQYTSPQQKTQSQPSTLQYSVNIRTPTNRIQQSSPQQLYPARQIHQEKTSRPRLTHHQILQQQQQQQLTPQQQMSNVHQSTLQHCLPLQQNRPIHHRPSQQTTSTQQLHQHQQQQHTTSYQHPPQPPPQYTQQHNSRKHPPQYAQKQLQYASQRSQFTTSNTQSLRQYQDNTHTNTSTTQNNDYTTDASVNTGCKVERNSNTYPVLVKNLRSSLTITQGQSLLSNKKVNRFTICHQSSPTAQPPANIPRNISSNISCNITSNISSGQHRSASANPSTSTQVLNLRRSESIPELIHLDNPELKGDHHTSSTLHDSLFTRSTPNTSVLRSPQQLSTTRNLTNSICPSPDIDHQPISMVKRYSKSNESSNFRNAPMLNCRDFLTHKHCVRKKEPCYSSSSEDNPPVYIEKRIQRLNRRVKRKKKSANFRNKLVAYSHSKIFCDHCKLKFESQSSLNRHMKFHCSVIKMQNKKKELNIKHEEDSDLENKLVIQEPILPCTKCGLMFETESLLKDHMQSHSPQDESSDQLLKKMLVKKEKDVSSTGESDSPVVKKKRNSYANSPHKLTCRFCPRSFPWISSLRRHLLTHTGQKPYKCPNCYTTFSTKSNRERHVYRKHCYKSHESSSRSVDEFKGHRCYICYKGDTKRSDSEEGDSSDMPSNAYTFDNRASLSSHFKEIHFGIEMPPEIPIFEAEGAALVEQMNNIANEIAARAGIFPGKSNGNDDTASSYSDHSFLQNEADGDTDSYTDTQYDINNIIHMDTKMDSSKLNTSIIARQVAKVAPLMNCETPDQFSNQQDKDKDINSDDNNSHSKNKAHDDDDDHDGGDDGGDDGENIYGNGVTNDEFKQIFTTNTKIIN